MRIVVVQSWIEKVLVRKAIEAIPFTGFLVGDILIQRIYILAGGNTPNQRVFRVGGLVMGLLVDCTPRGWVGKHCCIYTMRMTLDDRLAD